MTTFEIVRGNIARKKVELKSARRLPLVIFLHGAGGSGTDAGACACAWFLPAESETRRLVGSNTAARFT